MITVTDIFAGAGGSSTGAAQVPGLHVAIAANHWRLAVANLAQFGQYAPAIARQEQAFGYPAPSPTEPGRNNRPRLSAAFAEWMMGTPPGWITDVPGVTRNEALRKAGNGVVRQQAIAALLDMRAATHACPSRRASGEPCSPYCTDCGGRGWVA